MQITTRSLINNSACSGQVRTFRRLFGTGGEVTLQKLIRAAKADLDVTWAVRHFFNDAQRAEFWRIHGIADTIYNNGLRADKWWTNYGPSADAIYLRWYNPLLVANAYAFWIVLLRTEAGLIEG